MTPSRNSKKTARKAAAPAKELQMNYNREWEQQTQERLQYLLSSSPAVIYVSKASGDFAAAYISPNVEEQMGYSPGDFIEDPSFWKDHIHPEDRVRIMAGLSVLFDHGQQSHEYRFLHKDGNYRWMRDDMRLIRDADGNPVEIIGSWIDITEQVQAEEALQQVNETLEQRVFERTAELRENEEKYHSLVETASAGIAIMEKSGNLTFVNQTLCNMVGYTQEEMLGTPFSAYLHPEDIERVMELFQYGCQHPEEDQQLEYRLVCKDGRIIHCYSAPTKIIQAGEIIGFSAIVLDITEREQARQALLQSEEKHRNLVERATDGIIIIQDSKVIYANPSIASMWGGNVADIINTSFIDYVHPDAQEQVVDRYRRRIAGEQVPSIYETTLKRKDGRKLFAELNAEVITYEGKPADYVIIRDLTRRKQAEEQIRQRNADLQMINEINAVANRGESLNTIIDMISKESMRVYDSLGTTFYLLNENCDQLVMQNLALPQKMAAKIEDLIKVTIPTISHNLQSDSVYRQVIESKQGCLIADPIELQDLIDTYINSTPFTKKTRSHFKKLAPALINLLGEKSAMIVPLMAGEEVYGTLEMGSHNVFTEDDLQRFNFLAGQISATIQRKQAEEALRVSEEKFTAAFDRNSIALAITTAEGRWVSVNKAFCDLVGYTREELIGKTSAELGIINHNVRQRILDKEHSSGETRNAEVEIREQSGKVYTILMSAQPFHLNGIPYRITTNVDITERKRTEEQLAASEAEMRALFTAMTDLVIVYDADGKYLEIAPSSDALLYKPAGEVIGKQVQEVLPKNIADQIVACIRKALKSGNIEQLEYLLTINGRDIWFSANISKRDENSVIFIAHDITALKEQMNELQRWHDLMLDREDRSLELKGEVNELLRRLGEPVRYPSAEES
jgi:PAS domain S-box-containing protein